MTIQSLCRDVMDEIGIGMPSMLFGNSDVTAGRLRAATKRTGQALYRAHDWSILQREYPFTTTATIDNYALPDDWAHALANVAWDRTDYRMLRGSLSPAQWQRRRSELVSSPTMCFGYRLLVGPLAGSMLLDPVPDSAREMVIEYVSRFWCEDENGDGKAEPTADTDLVRLDHELFSLGLLWRIKSSFGMPYAADQATYEAELRTAIGNDLNMPMICVGGPRQAARLNLGSFTA